jgi:uncharacterized protein YkwD
MSANVSGVGLLLALPLAVPPAEAQVTQTRASADAPAANGDRAAKAPDLARVERLIVEQTNRFRRDNGLGELRVNPQLTEAACGFAAFMARTDKFSHTADDRQPWERTAAAGYEDAIVAENIAWELNSNGFTTPGLAKAFVEGWKASPHHRKNVLDPDLTEIGVGMARSDKSGRYYAVQDFGRPKSQEIVFSVANEPDRDVTAAMDGKDVAVQAGYTMTFRRGRPPTVALRLPDGKTETVRPHSSSRYVISADRSGRYQVEED